MKSLFKLIFLAVIAGFIFKYLNEKGINVSEKIQEAYEWISTKAGEIEKLASDKESAPEYRNDTRSAYEAYSSSIPYYESRSAVREKDELIDKGSERSEPADNLALSAIDEAEVEEYPVEEKETGGSERFPELDKYARETPKQSEASMETLAAWLKRQAYSEMEKARLIFTWIATHVAYDDNGYNTGNYNDTDAESVFRNRVAVCDGYASLFTALGNLAGLETVKIVGYAKGIGYRQGDRLRDTDHAWNAVRIDGSWRLFDVTWAAGYGKGVNGRLVTVMQFNDYWFNTRPDEFIFSHLPEDERWQLNEPKISKAQYENFPKVSGLYFKMGFNGSTCFPAVLNRSVSEFPEAYKVGGDIKMISMPLGKRIPSGRTIRIRIKSDNAVKIAFENKGQITDMKKEGNEFSALVHTTPGQLSLMANFGENSMMYQTFLEYVVE